MKHKKLSVALLALALLCVVWVAASAAVETDKAGWPDQLKFMAGPPGGNWFALGTALADMWTTSGLPQATSSSGGGVANIINASARKGDLGFSVTSLVGAAVKGEADFEGKAVDNAVIMSNLYTQYTYFIARKDFAEKHGLKTLGDVVGKKIPVRFATLKPGTSSEFVVKALFSKGYTIDYKEALKSWGGSVEYASYEGGADLLADNHLDIFAFSVGKVASIVMNIESKLDVVLLSVEQEALDALADAYGTETFTVEPGRYKCVTEPVKTVGDYTCVVVRKDLPESLVFELNKAIWDHKDALVAAVKDIGELDPAMALPAKVPCHPGSEKFWSGVK